MKIVWITADYFLDVDMPIVPLLQREYEVVWYVLKSYNSNIEIPAGYNFIIKKMLHRAKDPRIYFEYKDLFSQIANIKADLIYVDFLGVPYFYPILLNFRGISSSKIIHAAHNVIPYDGWPDKLIMKWYVKYVFRNVNNHHLFSKFLFNYFKEKYSNKNVLYAPLTLKSYGIIQTDNYLIDKDKCNLLFFGNVKPNKNLELLISAFKELPDNIQNRIHLTIAGSCNDKHRFISLIGDCKNITCYFKRIEDREVPELFLKHNYLALPYGDVAQSGPQMIAYNYNIPVIASDIDGFKERVIDEINGFLFKVNDLEDLKEKLIKIVNLNQEDYSQIKINLKKFIENNYSPEVVKNRYVDFFKKLLNEN